MAKTSALDERLFTLGTRQGRRDILPMVAYSVAQAAASREINPDDAQECFAKYYSGVNGKVQVDWRSPTMKVQVSKLRQIIRAADPKLMARVAKAHAKMRKAGEMTIPLYAAMVEAARQQERPSKPLADSVILQILTPRRRRRR